METVSVQRIRVFSWSTTLIGFMGICSGIQVNSIMWFCVAAALWGVAAKCIDRTWVFGAGGDLIMHNGSVWNRIDRNCSIVRSSLPKGFTFFRIKKNTVATLSTDLFVRADHGKGYIVWLRITIEAAIGVTPKEIGEYYRYFVQAKQKGDEYIGRHLKFFQQKEERGVGLLSAACRYEAGDLKWVDSLQQALQDFLKGELAMIGLRVVSVEIDRMDCASSILMQDGKVL